MDRLPQQWLREWNWPQQGRQKQEEEEKEEERA